MGQGGLGWGSQRNITPRLLVRLALHPARTGHHHTQDPKFSYKIPAANSFSSKFGEPFTHESISSSTNIYFHTHKRFLVFTTALRSFTSTSRLHYAASAFPPSVAKKLLSRHFPHIIDLHLKQYPETQVLRILLMEPRQVLEHPAVAASSHVSTFSRSFSRVQHISLSFSGGGGGVSSSSSSHTHRHVNALLTPTVIHLMENSKAFQLIFTLTKQLLM